MGVGLSPFDYPLTLSRQGRGNFAIALLAPAAAVWK